MKLKLAACTIAVALAAVVPAASAHHSFNMFALDKVETVTGTVKQVSWKMPHVWVYMTINGEDWGFECHAPNLVARKGWRSDSVKPGDKLHMTMHPMRDGSKAGSVINVTLANGKVLWNADSISQP
jgi:3-hydroxymyristoyl/3-hydroxydecanoyl-(acyl carrier protein) dehydratase